MTQKHGREYEHQLVNNLDEITPEEVWVAAIGFSGNSKSGDADVVISLDPHLVTSHEQAMYVAEAKKRQGEGGKRVSNVMTGSSTDETGLEELQRLVDNSPSWAEPLLIIKFDHREVVVLDARWVLSAIGADSRSESSVSSSPSGTQLDEGESERHVPDSVPMDILEPRLTPSENISMVKPPLTAWTSASAADDDVVVIAKKLGLPYEGDEKR
jgi:Holliday junction resolvase